MFTSQTLAPCFAIRSPSILAYTPGCSGRNGAPKQEEKVADGSVTPRSVPATLAVYPDRKWYIACSAVSRAMGGITPKASAVRKMTFLGCPARPLGS